MTATQHSDFVGGSSAARRIACPGSYKLEKDLPDQQSSYAAEGSALHKVVEMAMFEYTDTPGDNLDQIVGTEVEGIEVTPEHIRGMIEPAVAAVMHVHKKISRIVDFTMEARVEIPGGWEGEDVFGTTDLIGRLANNWLFLVDFKFGHGIQVSPDHSEQLGFYAGCALSTEYDPEDPEDPNIPEILDGTADKILFAIVQPTGSPILRTWETDETWVHNFMDTLRGAMENAVSDTPRFSVGEHCRFCKAKFNCGAFAKQSLLDTQLLEASQKGLDALDGRALSGILDRVPQVRKFIAAIEGLALTRLQAGEVIPNWEEVPKQARRVWNDSEAAEKKFRGTLRLKMDEWKPRRILTPPQAEKAVGKPKYEKHLEPLVTWHSSGTKLKRTGNDETTGQLEGLSLLQTKLQGEELQNTN